MDYSPFKILDSKTKLVMLYQTPGKTHMQIKTSINTDKYTYWCLVFMNKTGEIIKSIKTHDTDIKLTRLKFHHCELYWINEKKNETIALHYLLHPLYRNNKTLPDL